VANKVVPDKFKPHQLEPDPDWLAQKLALMNVKPGDFQKMDPLIICALRQGVTVHPQAKVPKLIDIVSQTRYVTPRDIGTLKELAGTPQRAFVKPARPIAPVPVPEPVTRGLEALPAKVTSITKLAGDQRLAFFHTANQLLHGPADEQVLARAGYAQVAAGMLKVAAKLPVFVAPDLVVCAGQHVTFAGYGALYFNNVLIQGDGQITLGNHTKLHAYQIKRF
jgi:hypothetical protein